MKKFAVLGAGMQGTAGGYFLGRWGQAESIIMADISEATAQKAADRLNQLFGRPLAKGQKVDAKSPESLRALFSQIDGCLSATSYEFNEGITLAAIEAGICLVDLGGNTDVVLAQLKLNERAQQKGISIVPDCGLAPGLGNTLAALGIQELDSCESVSVRCGGLAQNPRPPLGYKLVFSIKGLTNEYFGKAWIIRNGKRVSVDTFSELEDLEFAPPVGRCEAFVTTGGSSTCPWTFEGKVKNYDYKTVRYKGHYDKMKCMLDLGLLDLNPVSVNGTPVVPRDLFHAVVPAKIDFPEDHDLVVLRATCKGLKGGKPAQVVYDLMDFQDAKTGFTAMERTTAFPAALVLIHGVRGQAQKGVVPLESALNNRLYVDELSASGITIKTTWSSLD